MLYFIILCPYFEIVSSGVHIQIVYTSNYKNCDKILNKKNGVFIFRNSISDTSLEYEY